MVSVVSYFVGLCLIHSFTLCGQLLNLMKHLISFCRKLTVSDFSVIGNITEARGWGEIKVRVKLEEVCLKMLKSTAEVFVFLMGP